MFGHNKEPIVININETNNYYGNCGPHAVHLVLKSNINNSTYLLMAQTLAANQKVAAQFGLVDQTTLLPVTGSFSGQSGTSDNTAVATVSVDSNGNLVVTAVAAGSCNVVGSATAAYTDSTGASQSKALSTQPIAVTVTAVVVADQVSLVLNFGNPTAQ
jgi:hypothetical protein